MDPGRTTDVQEEIPIIWANEKAYNDARVARVFNHRRPQRYPLAIVHATTENDVMHTIKLAKNLNCKVSIRSGGHSWAAWSVRDNAILVDLVGMNSIEYDEASGIVKAGPATTSEQLNTFLEPYRRMFNSGHSPSVGLGGFLYVPSRRY